MTFFNHESELRQETFVSQKICKSIAEIHFGLREKIALGNLQIKRDWSYAYDFMDALLMLNDSAVFSNYILASGSLHSVQNLLDVAFSKIGITNTKEFVIIDPEFIRKTESKPLTGDSSKFRNRYGWKPKTSFNEMIYKMVDFQIERISKEKGARFV